jgi:hypothetical protein
LHGQRADVAGDLGDGLALLARDALDTMRWTSRSTSSWVGPMASRSAILSSSMDLRVGGFDWDEGNRAKCQKHGLSIAQIEALFARSPRIAPDPKHSGGRGIA